MKDIYEGVKGLGFGMMRLPKLPDGTVDLAATNALFDYYIGRGFSYFDTAYSYGDGKIEEVVRSALAERFPREKWKLATKLPIWLANETADLEKMFRTQLERTGAGFFDFYLLHSMTLNNAAKCDKLGAWDFLKKKKADGQISHFGFSFHDKAEVLDDILTKHPEAEFVQLQINYSDWDDNAVQSRLCYETAVKHGKPVVVMEPVKGGSLLRVRPEILDIFREAAPGRSLASWALRFAGSLPNVRVVLSGMNEMSQVRENCETMGNFEPLGDGEREVIAKVVAEIKKVPEIPCTRCNYCIEGCPQNIPIPHAIGGLNLYNIYNNYEEAKEIYGHGMVSGGCASDCIECGACESRCPQHIPIVETMKEAARVFGR